LQNSERRLLAGAEILGRKLYPLGFSFEITERGKGSGGHFTIGRFTNGDREITLWFRWELGGVSYRKRDVEANHPQYMQALGRDRTATYPGFGQGDEMAGFYHLLSDLDYCNGFLTDEGNAFYGLMKEYRRKDEPKGLAGLSRFDQAKPDSD
jgi:hypothetical protein